MPAVDAFKRFVQLDHGSVTRTLEFNLVNIFLKHLVVGFTRFEGHRT